MKAITSNSDFMVAIAANNHKVKVMSEQPSACAKEKKAEVQTLEEHRESFQGNQTSEEEQPCKTVREEGEQGSTHRRRR